MTRRTLILALVALAVFASAFQGIRGLWEPDEGRYVNVALYMRRNGNWLHPRINRDTPHYAKPPLTYWAIAGSVSLFGRNEWAARLPNALAFALTVALVYRMGRLFVPGKPWLPALVYATSAFPYAAAGIVTADTLLTLWETLAVLGFASFWWGAEPRARRGPLLLMWAAFGLAFATKGPPGLLPLGAILLVAGLDGGAKGARQVFPIAGVAAFLAIGLSWYVAVAAAEPRLFRYFLADEVVGRVITGQHGRNPGWWSFALYLPVLLLGSLPWTWAALRGIPAAARLLRRARHPDVRHGRSADLFLLVWFLLSLGVFSLARSRLPLYVLPLFVPLALLVARRLGPAFSLSAPRAASLAAWAVLLMASPALAGAWADPARDTRPLAQAIRAQAGFQPRTILVMEQEPHYGLSLYFDAEIEEMELNPPERLHPSREVSISLLERIQGVGAATLLLVRERDLGRFEALVRRAGRRAIPAGSFRALHFFTLS